MFPEGRSFECDSFRDRYTGFKGNFSSNNRQSRAILVPDFCVPKPSGDFRVILNLKKINRFLPDQKFCMETLSSIFPQLSSLDWAVSIDLKDA